MAAGILLATIALVQHESAAASRLPDFLSFLPPSGRVSLSIEPAPPVFGERVSAERGVEAVFAVPWATAVSEARTRARRGPFREVAFPLPGWIVFESNDGRIVGLLPVKGKSGLTKVVYGRPSTPWERFQNALRHYRFLELEGGTSHSRDAYDPVGVRTSRVRDGIPVTAAARRAAFRHEIACLQRILNGEPCS